MHTPDSVSPTVAEAAELWLRPCERDKLEQHEGRVRLYIVPRIGGTRLSRLTAPLANEFVDQLLTAGRSRELCRRVLISLSSIVTEPHTHGMRGRPHGALGDRPSAPPVFPPTFAAQLAAHPRPDLPPKRPVEQGLTMQ